METARWVWTAIWWGSAPQSPTVAAALSADVRMKGYAGYAGLTVLNHQDLLHYVRKHTEEFESLIERRPK